MTPGDGRADEGRRLHCTDADPSPREVDCPGSPVLHFRVSVLSWHVIFHADFIDFMRRNASPVPTCATLRFYHQIEEIYIEHCLLRTPLLDRPWEGAGEEPDTCCSWPAPMTDRRAWWLLSPAPGWVEENSSQSESQLLTHIPHPLSPSLPS